MTQYAIKKDNLDEFQDVRKKILAIKDFLDPGTRDSENFQFKDVSDKIDSALTALNDLEQSSIPSKHYMKSIRKEMQTNENKTESDNMKNKERKELRKSQAVPNSLKSSSTQTNSGEDAFAPIEKEAEKRVEKGESENFATAVTTVVKQNPAMYRKYREAKYPDYSTPSANYSETSESSPEDYGYNPYTGYYSNYSSYGDSAWQKIRREAKELLENEENDLEDFPSAVARVLRDNRKLYRAYRKEKNAEYKEVEKSKQPRQRLT